MTAKEDIENTGDSNAVSVESTALFALLESRHETMLQWCEPWPACGPQGNELDAHIVLRATVHDCINMQRRVAKAAGRPTMGDDGNHLLDFMAIHWTRVVEATGSPPPNKQPEDDDLLVIAWMHGAESNRRQCRDLARECDRLRDALRAIIGCGLNCKDALDEAEQMERIAKEALSPLND